ncbi:Complex 1 family protein [Rhynchospora pubera]|uniref:Complex 1 family protein n=1 Tax=Rhynchospora pubera TaxID=906938 RepID=A0AAV8FBN6_9POAL|nr:Complex 1 family protein [Rhynchospora pubera]KAJ4761796.1 Complex 1 family protein [Rhynchospora pubera]KAJ4790439.1 Complex 1 family protein [Rhynchospora pubera]KAJ4814284.1 Complex 1 family protein [Rhynchospora pubera]
MASGEAMAAYRALLRATRRTFAGDTLMLAESKKEIRRHFEEKRGVTAEAELRELLDQAKEASHFIQHMILQAKRSPSGSFVVKPEKEHTGATLEVPSEEILSKSRQ